MGKSIQIPPMYSALKVGGTRLHELARAGVEVEREGRPIKVFNIRALEVDGPRLTFEVTCTRGTYIRVLVEDIARALGTVAHTTELRRLAVGPFSGVPMVTLEQPAEELQAARQAELAN